MDVNQNVRISEMSTEFFVCRETKLLKVLRAYQTRTGRRVANIKGVNIGRRFSEAVVRAAREGRLLYRDAFQLTGLTGRTFDEFAKRQEGSV